MLVDFGSRSIPDVHLRSFYDKPERRPAKIEFELQVAQLFLADIWVIRSQQGDGRVIVGVALLWPPGVDIWKESACPAARSLVKLSSAVRE